jgi:hypothetical protein
VHGRRQLDREPTFDVLMEGEKPEFTTLLQVCALFRSNSRAQLSAGRQDRFGRSQAVRLRPA